MSTGGQFDTSSANVDYEAKAHQLFNALLQRDLTLIDLEKELATVSAHEQTYLEALVTIIKRVENAQSSGKKIRAKEFILDLYRIAMTAYVKHAPDPKAETKRLVNRES